MVLDENLRRGNSTKLRRNELPPLTRVPTGFQNRPSTDPAGSAEHAALAVSLRSAGWSSRFSLVAGFPAVVGFERAKGSV